MAVNNVLSGQLGSSPLLKKNAGEAEKTSTTATKETIKTALNAYTNAAQAPTVKDAANVQISQKAKELSLAKKIISDTPTIREDKVEKFKDLIKKGEYKPDPNKIAAGIVSEAIKDELAKTPEVVFE